MSKQQVWVVERRALRGTVWRLHVACAGPSAARPNERCREWTHDGHRYRFVKYVPETP